ncbi:phosphopantetheine-binding protein [Streptomyces sp. NPDC053560]|uniref:phosphopantetheine-binding protein n=1 Tax=Streptomyces sp. NPDC053560 TaxID=3365711 RepID=UPI0037CEC011
MSAKWDDQFEELVRGFLPFMDAAESLTEDLNMREAGLDSLGAVELLAALEDLYQVRFVDDALTMDTFATPGVLWGTVSKLSTAAAG